MPATGLAYSGATRDKNVGVGDRSGPQLVALLQERQPLLCPLPVCGSSRWCSCNLRPALTYNTLVISQSSKRSLTVNSCAQPSAKIRVL